MNAGWLGTRTTSKRTEHRRGRKRRRKPKQGIRGVSREYREESQSLQGLSRKESAAFPAWVNRLRKKWLGTSFRAERGISLWRKPKKRGIHRTKDVRCKTVPHSADSVWNDGKILIQQAAKPCPDEDERTVSFAVAECKRYAAMFCGGCDAFANENETLARVVADRFDGFHGTSATVQPETLRRDALALHRAVPRRAHGGDQRRAAPAQRVLHGGGEWRSLENDRLRQHVVSDFRRATLGVRWGAGGGGFQPGHSLCGERRRAAAPRPRRGRRHL